MYNYRIVRPGSGIVSRHKYLNRAIDALECQRRGARRQGGYSKDYLEQWDSSAGEWRTFHEPSDYPTPAPSRLS